MYDNPYNRRIADDIYKINKRYIDHIDKIYQEGPVGGSCGACCGCDRCSMRGGQSLRTVRDEGEDPIMGEGYSAGGETGGGETGGNILDTVKKVYKRGKRTAKALGNIFLGKKGDFKDLANVMSLGKYGEMYGDGMSAGAKKRGRPKKMSKMEVKKLKEGNGFPTFGFGKSKKMKGNGMLEDFADNIGLAKPKRTRQTKKSKEDEKLAMEVKGLKNIVKKGKKSGSGVISGLLGALGLGKSGGAVGISSGAVNSGPNLFVSPQQQLDLIKSQGGAKKKNVNVIDNIVKSVGKGMAGAKEYKKGGAKTANPRKIGGRKLLLKEEMPPSSMSGGKKKVGGAWGDLVKEVKAKNPHLKGLKEVIKHIKDNNLYQKK